MAAVLSGYTDAALYQMGSINCERRPYLEAQSSHSEWMIFSEIVGYCIMILHYISSH